MDGCHLPYCCILQMRKAVPGATMQQRGIGTYHAEEFFKAALKSGVTPLGGIASRPFDELGERRESTQ
jgi:hypothetical protein